jgi:dihydroflavonol-4-reductase
MTHATKAISPANGPVAITGATGFIGSWVVQDFVEQGYSVHACVRDASNHEKVDHLLAMNDQGLRGQVQLFEGDVFERGSYDDAFNGCSAVVHTGTPIGNHGETPQQVYDGAFTELDHVLKSAISGGNLRRFVFTSSQAAIGHPQPEGFVYNETHWCDDNPETQQLDDAMIPKNRDFAYKLAKARSERMLYARAESDGTFEAMSLLPIHVLGPLMCRNHDQPWSWQSCIRYMLAGKDYRKSPNGRMFWVITDVRDVARAHRLCAESTIARNGSRYLVSPEDRSGELRTWELQAKLRELFPYVATVGGEEMAGDKPAKYTPAWHAYCLLAKQELGLRPYSIDDTLRATGDSYFRLGILP